ncbi:MAG: hypothetical protein KA780_06815 [Prolixibacteraceae bacterium]|nr:hypothetical protein [Prolixibacteraceae bacterium]
MYTSDPTFEPVAEEGAFSGSQTRKGPRQGKSQDGPVLSRGESSGDVTAEAGGSPRLPIAGVIPQVPETKPQKHTVSGRYEGAVGGYRIELRVDVDGVCPMQRVSGDFFRESGATTLYYGSFIVHEVEVKVTASKVTLQGLGSFSFEASAPEVRVTIPRRAVSRRRASAALQFYTVSGTPGIPYSCEFVSSFFRTVCIETDRVSDVTTPGFSNYDTGMLPSGGPVRVLDVAGAYAEAGIEMISSAGGNVVDISAAGENATWSNAELHAAMVSHFTLYHDLPRWAVWQLVARQHDLGSALYGIMFDQEGKQRQGCAVFYEGIGGDTPEKQRLQLYTGVHELGHCFNLLHSWQKSMGTPPRPNRPEALSWMNYPWNYPSGGPEAFWSRFGFSFDSGEVIHLRHAFRNDIIMGGHSFASGAALGREVLPDVVRDDSGLQLRISTHQESFALGEPVVLEIGLHSAAGREREDHGWIHPNFGMVKVVIQKPNGEVVTYEPLIDHLVGQRAAVVRAGEEVKDSAYIGFGKGGFYFGQPGQYLVRAVYAAADGSEILSGLIRVRIRYPVTEADESLADLFMGQDQGSLLYLLGSDSDHLRNGNAAFDEILDRHGAHPMANYARLIKGINAARDFKTIHAESRVVVRGALLGESTELLAMAATSRVLDTVTTQMTLSNLAEVQVRSGDETSARVTLDMLSSMA